MQKLLIYLFFIFTNLQFCNKIPFNQLTAKHGVFDLRNYDFDSEGFVKLDGEWEFYWKEFLLSHEDFQKKEPTYFNLPKTWNKVEIEGKKQIFGYATFRLKVLLLPNVPELWIRPDGLFSSHHLYANGMLVANSGKVGKSKEDTVHSVVPSIGVIQKPGEVLELVVHVSNYAINKGGIQYSILLGNKKSIFMNVFYRLFSDIFLMGSMLIMGTYYMTIYFLRRVERQVLLFSIICFIFVIRTACLNERTIGVLFPNLPMAVYMKLLYSSYFIAMAFLVDFLLSFFQSRNLRSFIQWNYRLCFLGLVFVILVPLFYASYSLDVINIQVIVLLSFILYQFFRHRLEVRDFIVTFFAGIFILTITVVNDILVNSQVYQGKFLIGYGIIAFVFTLSHSLSIRLIGAFRNVEVLSESLKKANENIVKFVPHEFIRLLGRQSIHEVELGAQAPKELCILFSDIRSFTSLAEKMSPEECFQFLNSYYERIGPIVRKHGGFIDKYMGDGIMALFPNKVEDALQASIEMQEEVKKINLERRLQGKREIKIGIGIHKGPSIIGIIGEKQRTDSTVIADAVNLASRIESLTKDFSTEILVSAAAFLEVEDPFDYEFRFLGKVQVKGKSEFVVLVEILNSLPKEHVENILKTKVFFEEALGLFDLGSIEEAERKFQEVLSQNPDDSACLYYLNRMKNQQKSVEVVNF